MPQLETADPLVQVDRAYHFSEFACGEVQPILAALGAEPAQQL